MAIINLENFFDFNNQNPINRIAYTEEDAKYKLKYIRAMQDLGMKISIDNVGNICGTLSGSVAKSNSIVLGSHTDSVIDGGQFDGPVGVYMALKSIEDFKKSNLPQYANLKAVIYACEESTRFSKACLGSYYLSGKLNYETILNLKDQNNITFKDAIAEYKNYIFSHLVEYGIDLNNITMVDKILNEEEISEAIEAHIEQAEVLVNSNTSIGCVDSIGKPLRGKINVNGKNSIVTAAKIISKFNELSFKSKTSDSEESLRITVPKFNTVPTNNNSQKIKSNNSDLLKITALGKSNHSGSTPMSERRDAVLGISKLILKLDTLQKENTNLHFKFLSSATEKWSANIVPSCADLLIRVDPPSLLGVINSFAEDIEEESGVAFNIKDIDSATVQQETQTDLFVDIRQQYPTTAISTQEKVYEMFKNIQNEYNSGSDSISFKINSMDDPILTTPELLQNIKEICNQKKYPCQILHSWPGHDLACILPTTNKTGKKILFFIPSEGGSHNPNETTSKEAIEIGTDVYSILVSQRMSKFNKKLEKQNIDEPSL